MFFVYFISIYLAGWLAAWLLGMRWWLILVLNKTLYNTFTNRCVSVCTKWTYFGCHLVVINKIEITKSNCAKNQHVHTSPFSSTTPPYISNKSYFCFHIDVTRCIRDSPTGSSNVCSSVICGFLPHFLPLSNPDKLVMIGNLQKRLFPWIRYWHPVILFAWRGGQMAADPAQTGWTAFSTRPSRSITSFIAFFSYDCLCISSHTIKLSCFLKYITKVLDSVKWINTLHSLNVSLRHGAS